MKVLTFFVESYVHPLAVNPLTVNRTAVVFLPSVVLLTVQVPPPLVMQLVAPDPADQVPATETPASGPVASAAPIVTVAVQLFRTDAVVPVRLPTHIAFGGGGVDHE